MPRHARRDILPAAKVLLRLWPQWYYIRPQIREVNITRKAECRGATISFAVRRI